MGLPPAAPSALRIGTNPGNDLSYLVDPRRHPDWAGPFNPEDCKQAQAKMKISVQHYDAMALMVFWSRRWNPKPGHKDVFELPWIAVSGTCTLLLRIAKDFGDNVLPSGEGYESESKYPIVALFNWYEAFLATDYLLDEILQQGRGLVGWQHLPMQGWPAVAMYIPTGSRMSRKWAGWSLGNPVNMSDAHNSTVDTA
ncbi:MAG: hypothetical protein LQ350_002444 [Teloschistes chrysophthalmus]|nr:MAG: hypothetical protein LQ350_002444 [Niorma chrysophthalma]